MIFTLINCFVLLKQIFASCPYYDNSNYWDQVFDSNIDWITIDISMFQFLEKLGIGFWFNYLPNSESLTSQPFVINQVNYLLYIVENVESTEYSIIFYLDIDADLEQIKLKGVFQLQTQSYIFEYLLDAQNFEGDWHLLYYFVDQATQQITIYVFNSRTEVIFSKQQSGSIQYGKRTFQRNFGTFQILQGSEVVKYKYFPGKLGFTFITFFQDIFTNLKKYNAECPIFYVCIEGESPLVEYNQEFKKNKIISGSTIQNEIQKVGYVIQGWVKLNKIESIQQLDTVLLRVTTRYSYFNDKQYGDRLIYIVYHQNIIQDENGLTVSLNSYKFPIIEETYQHDDLDTITIMGKQYSEAIIHWHFFQYEIGTKTNNGQPVFTIYFALLNQKQQWKWNKQINHFTNSKFYYFIGGDDFVSNQFSGFLSDWSFSIYCNPVDVEFKIKCHFSCETCDGISSSNCLSCNNESHRLYSNEQKRCQCAYGYIEVADREICQTLEETMGNLVVDEYERKCDKVGYFACSEDNIQCDYGYFMAGNECLMCPRLNFAKLDEDIECGDCVLAPESFSSTLICSYDFKVLDVSKQFVYQKISRQVQQQEIFKIVQNEFGKRQLTLVEGEYIYGCKYGYYKDLNGKCKKCQEGCSGCLIDSSCQFCFIGYTMRKDGNCQKCESCHNCMLENNKEVCLYETDCLSNQYWSNNQCYDCGQYCAKCIQSKCLYCVNNQDYFISFDKLNCAICNIKDCQYCFQYYQSDGKYYTTLDYEPFMENIQQELIKIGCAQCNQNMYFNFQTNQCEELLTNDSQCSFGIITQDSGKAICIKSLIPLGGIQQTACSSISFCEQCILNYINVDGFCIKCSDGYYSSITTGQCKQCPLTCKTCQQQNTNHYDFWKWDIKAFYKYFVNSNDDHYFEQYGLNFNTKNFEIVCTSCFSDSFLYQNTCYKNCGQDCNNCQIITTQNSVTPQTSQCFQCNNALYNKQRSTNQNDLTVCQECVVFCKACQSRDISKINELNPFITNIQKYTNLCYSFDKEIQQSDEDIKYNIKYKNEINFHPFFKTPYKCQIYDKCIKTLTFSQFVYCDSSYRYFDFFNEQRQNYRAQYKTYYEFSVYGIQLQNYIYDFLNEQSIMEVNFVNLLKTLPKYPGNCFQWEAQSVNIKNPFSSQIFTIKTVRIKLIGEQLTLLLTQVNYSVINFDEVHFQNVGLLATSTLSHPQTSVYNINCKINILNSNFPVTFKLIDSQILSTNNSRQTSYTIMSNNSLNILFDNVTFLDLNLTDSKLIDFQPLQSTKNPKFNAQNLVFINSNFTQSSIFYFESLKFSSDYQISITNVYASNLTFRAGSQFINTSFLMQYHIGDITLENFYFENITLMNASQILNLMGAGQCSIKNITLKNIIFLDSSSFLISNIINIEDFLAIDLIIYTGQLITNKGTSSKTSQALKNAESIRIKNASFIENIYHNSQCFIAIIQNQILNNSLIIEGLILRNNQYYNILKGVNQIKSLTNDQSLIYLECQVCILDKLEIFRGLGYPEIAIFQSKVLKFSNILIQQSPQFITKTLHSSYKCIEQFLYLDTYFVFYLSSFNQVELDNVVIFQSVIFDNPFFLFASQNQFDELAENKIIIKNSLFFDNMLIVTQQNKFTSIIYIKTEQLMNINIVNTNFTKNYLNEYFQDYQLFSSSTLVIYAQSCDVIISNCIFDQNIISNSTDSNLFIKANYLSIQNSVFKKQNQLNPTIFQKYLFVSKTDTEVSSNIMLNFQVLSSGGNGYLLINSMLLEEIEVEQSLALNGGAFYIITTQQGSIEISSSKFRNTSTTINGYQISVGGCFYIDSSKSRFNLYIHDSIFEFTSSRTQAGLLYIEPSFLKNEINLDNLTIEESFSIQNSILTFSPSRQNSVYSNFKIQNSLIINSENAFDYYISQLQDISSQDVKPFQRENPTIYVQYCNFTMVNCSFIQFHIATILEIYNGYLINLNNIEISNSTYYVSPILRISLREGFMGKILLQDLKLQKLQQIQTQFEDCQEMEIVAIKDLLCFDDLSDIVQNPLVELKKYNLTNQLICNKKLIFEEANYNMSLVEIKSIDKEQELIIENLLISNIECSNCYFGVFTVQDVNVNSMNLRMKNVSLVNNICGVIGCLSFLQNSNFILNDNQQNRILQNSVEKIKNILNKKIQLQISNSLFTNNIADYGGACFFIDLNLLIDKCLFNNNEARQTGGAIYYYSVQQNHILILDSQLIQNKAQIGGGLFQNGETIQEFTQGNVYIKENLGTKYADNLASVPMYLHLSLDGVNLLKNKLIFKNQTTQIDEVDVQPYSYLGSKDVTDQLLIPSGLKIYDYKHFDSQSNSYIDYNFSFRIIPLNIQFEQMKNLNGTECTINPSVVNRGNLQEKIQNIMENISAQSLSYTNVKFNDQTQDYNLDNLTVYFNPSQEKQYSLQLAFMCKAIKIPVFNNYSPYELNYTLNNYILLLHLRTFKCQLGEYLNSTSGGCVQCDITQNQYSVQENAQACQFKDEQKMKSIKPAMIELRSGYWRAYYYSNVVELCYHQQQNCQGGWFAGNPSCGLGHIGALCEQCDLYNIRGQGYFSISQAFGCSGCEQVAKNIINIVLVVLWTLLSLFISVTSTVQMIEEFIFQLKLKSLRNYFITQPTSTSVLLKVFTNYLQIISSITSFQLSIPSGISLLVSGVGNPMDSMAFSLDCFLADSNQNVPILYFRIIFSLLTVGIYILLFFSIYILLLFVKKSKFQITFITTTFIYIYIYLFPNIVSGLIGLLSYRKISNEYWVSGNVSYLYNTYQHTIWLISFVIPSLFILGLLVPFLFWFVVYYNRKQLNSMKVRKMWGYLYNEYKLETYYWETLKILQKEIIILVLLYYSDYVAVKASLVFLILYIYSHLSTKYKPYQSGPLNKIDFLSTSICSISIVIASSIYTAQSFDIIEVVLPFYTILAVLNFLFVANMLQKLIYAYFDKMEKTIDEIKTIIYLKFPHIINKNRTLKRIFIKNSLRKKLIKGRFKMIRHYLMNQAKQIIEFKSSMTFDQQIPKSTTRKDDQTMFTDPLSISNRNAGRLLRQNRYFKKQTSVLSFKAIVESKQE